MIINQGNLSALFTGYSAAFSNGFRDVKPLWSRVATQVPSSTRQEKYAWLGQYPRLREWVGDRVVKGMAAHDYSIVNKTFESTIAVPREDLEDDSYGVFAPLFAEMAFAAATHPDELIFALLKAAFATLCYDGQNFFDANHPVPGAAGGVYSNHGGGAATQWYLLDVSRPLKPLIFQQRRAYALQAMQQLDDERVFMSKEFLYGVDARLNVGLGFWQQAFGSKVALDAAGYAAARAAMMGVVSDDGRPLGIMPNLLVVPPSLEGAARTLLLLQYAAPGVINPWFNTAEILVVPWLT